MGFLASYYGLVLSRLRFHPALALSYIKITMRWVFHFVGLYDSGELDSSSWQDFPDMNFSPVPSISADTIRKNLPVIPFGKFAETFCEAMGNDIVCAVCLNSFEEEEHIRELCNCHHVFHRNCLDKWLDHRQTTCPLCRSFLMPERIPDSQFSKSWVVDRIAYIFSDDLVISSQQRDFSW